MRAVMFKVLSVVVALGAGWMSSAAEAGVDIRFSGGHGNGYYNDHRYGGYGSDYGYGYGHNDDRDTVRCESRDGRYRECRIDGYGGVQIVRQLSNRSCIEGRNWGFTGNSVWVDDGCRAEFATYGGGYGYNSGYRGGHGYSGRPGYGGPVWSNGYRGQSRGWNQGGYGYGNGYNGYGGHGQFTCESRDHRYNFCPVNIGRGGVQLAYQFSNNACIRGRTWGFERGGIWVDGGCRAQFVIR